MLKAILLITVLGVDGDYTVEMPSMEECLDARVTIAEQNPTVKTLCIPMADDTAKMQELFTIFMNMIDQIREKESEIGCDEKSKFDLLKETPTSCSQDSPLKRN